LGIVWRTLKWKMLLYYICIHLSYFMPFCILYGHLIYISPFWYVVPRKIWQPWKPLGKTKSWDICVASKTITKYEGAAMYRVARFFLVHHTKKRKIYQINGTYVYQMDTKYTRWPYI
jgi:hypothetical protein